MTLGGDYGDWSGVDIASFTLLGAVGVYSDNTDGVDYTYVGSASILHDPTGLSLTLSGGGQKVDEGDTPSNFYAKLGWDTEFWPIGATGFGIDYTSGKNIAGDGIGGDSYGIAAVQRIDRYGIDLYTQARWFDPSSSDDLGLKNVFVGTFERSSLSDASSHRWSRASKHR